MTSSNEYKCDECGEPAVMVCKVIRNETTHEMYLCEECAEKTKVVVDAFTGNSPLVSKKVLASAKSLIDLAALQCPECGIKFMDFRRQGRLGCPNDYEFFREGLLPLIGRVQRSGKHVGKMPAHQPLALELFRKTRLARKRLKQAIELDHFEEAAQIRDEIKQLEVPDAT